MCKNLVILCFLISYFVFTSATYALNDVSQTIQEPEINVNDSNESNVIVTSVMDTKIDKQKNMIYCATMQMAWNEFTKIAGGGIIKVENEPEYHSNIELKGRVQFCQFYFKTHFSCCS